MSRDVIKISIFNRLVSLKFQTVFAHIPGQNTHTELSVQETRLCNDLRNASVCFLSFSSPLCRVIYIFCRRRDRSLEKNADY